MFGLLKSASCGLSKEDRREWWQHICGVCLALHRNVGQVGRLTTNYDSAFLSLICSQQMIEPAPLKQGICILRKPIRANTVAPDSLGAQFGGALALIMASIKLKDQLADGDIGRRSAKRIPAGIVAEKWEMQGKKLADKIGFNSQPLFDLAQTQFELESKPNQDFSIYARPTEQAVGIAFAHTAVLANQPENISLLQQIGGAYGRLMFLLDSYKDFKEDVEQGKFNALAETDSKIPYQSIAQSLWRDAHQRLTENVIQLNGGHSFLSTTLLVSQLNQIGERAMNMPHACAVCFSTKTSKDIEDEREENRQKHPAGLGYDCCNGCYVCCECCVCCECNCCC